MSKHIDADGLSFSLTLHSPMTKEDWAKIEDLEMESVPAVTFTTPSGKEVLFRKVKPGEWVGNSFDFYCSNCKHYQNVYAGKSNFCPHCGADMRGKSE